MPGSPPTRRVVETLEHLAEADAPRTIAQVADAVGIARPTMSAVLTELADAGWVVRDAARAYSLGPGVASLTRGSSEGVSPMAAEIVAVAGELVAATSCGATISRFTADRMTVVAKVHSQARPVPGLGLGQSIDVSYPSGAAVMAWRPPSEQVAWLTADGKRSPRRRVILDGVRDLGYAAYRPASSDASLIESLADLLSAVGPMLIDPTVRRTATRQLSELGSRAYLSDDLMTDSVLPISYLAAPVFARGEAEYELQLGVLRSAVEPVERAEFATATVEAASRISALLDAGGG